MAVLGLLVAIPLTMIVRGGGDDGDEPSETIDSGPLQSETGAVRSDRKLKINLRLPKGWRRERQEGGAVALLRQDGGVVIAISTPGPAEDAAEIQREALAAIESQYRKVETTGRTRDLELGGRRAISATLVATHPKKKKELRILISTAKGRKMAYLVEVVAADLNQGLVEAQAVLSGLRLKG